MMARINIENIGGAVDSRFRKARILKVHPEDDTADIELVDTDEKYLKVPIFYHCEPEAKQRNNGALEGAAAAFEEGDIVYVKFKKAGEKLQNPVIVAGEELKACAAYNIILFYYDHDEQGNKVVRAALIDVERDKFEIGHTAESIQELGYRGHWNALFDELAPIDREEVKREIWGFSNLVFHDLTSQKNHQTFII
jgi:DNA-directed RNA polymerase subunit K/omega